MSRALLDTSFVIAATAPVDTPESAAVSVVTIGELHAGVLLAGDDRERSRRRERLVFVRARFEAIPIDEPVAERYGNLLALVRASRRSEKATDLLIVATAAATDRRLYTLDERQAAVARLAGLEVSLTRAS